MHINVVYAAWLTRLLPWVGFQNPLSKPIVDYGGSVDAPPASRYTLSKT
jgi:hypothetical protein